MTTRYPSIGTRFFWNGQEFEIRQRLPGSHLNIADSKTGVIKSVSFDEIVAAIARGEIHFDKEKKGNLAQPSVVDWSDWSEEQRAIAEFRYEVIRPLLELPSYKRFQAILNRVAEIRKIYPANPDEKKRVASQASIYRWLHDFEESNNDIQSLIPRGKRSVTRRKSRLDATVNSILQTTISDYAHLERCGGIDKVHRELTRRLAEENSQRIEAERLPTVSRAHVARSISQQQVEGKLAHIKKRQDRYGRHPNEERQRLDLPLQRVEIDHTQTDVFVVDGEDMEPAGRLTLTYCIDVMTRYPLGFYLGFEEPSYLTVMECLYHSILPKENVKEKYGTEHDWLAYGIPYTLVVDNGKEFTGNDLKDACRLLNITIERAPAHTPKYKATVERIFGTINTGFFHNLPGTSFSNIEMRGDYDSLKKACITADRLSRMLHMFTLDIYAEDEHRGLKGIPARAWEEHVNRGFFPRVPNSAEDLRILLGRVAHRTIQPYGIELNGLEYYSPDLEPLRVKMRGAENNRAKLKFHPGDLGLIHVLDPFEKRYIQVWAKEQAYAAGLSLWKHKLITREARRSGGKVDVAALGEAQRRLQAEMEEAKKEKKSIRARSRAARFQESGKTQSAIDARRELLESGDQSGPHSYDIEDSDAYDYPDWDMSDLKRSGYYKHALGSSYYDSQDENLDEEEDD